MASYDVTVKLVDQTRTPLRNIENGLRNVEDRTAKLNRALGNIGGALTAVGTAATAAFGVAARNALNFANQVDDVANATNISRDSIVGFANAVKAAGGETNSALDAINRFNENLSAAAGGSRELREAFAAVGVSLDDIAKKTAQQNFDQVVAGLGQIANQSQRAALQSALLGRGLRGVNAAQVADEYGNISDEQRILAENIKLAADATDVLERAFNRLRDRIINALGPVNKFIAELKPETIDRFIDAIVGLTTALVAITGAIKLFNLIGSVFGGAIAALTGAFLLFGRGVAQTGAQVATQTFRFGAFFATIKRALPVLVGLGTATITVGGAARTISGPLQALGFIFERITQTLGLLIARFLPGFLGGIARMAPAIGLVTAAVIGLNAAIASLGFDPIDAAATKLEDLANKLLPKSFVDRINQLGQRLGMAPSPATRAASEAQAALERSRQQQAMLSTGGGAGELARTTGDGGTGLDVKDITAWGRLQEQFKNTREDYEALSKAIREGIDDPALLSAAFDQASRAAETLGIVLQKPISIINRDLIFGLDQAEEKLRQQAIELKNTGAQYIKFDQEARTAALANEELALKLNNSTLQQKIYANELRASNLQLQDQQQRLNDINLQQGLYRNEIDQAAQSLQDQRQRLADTTLQQALYRDEIARGNLELVNQRQRLSDATLQQALYAQEVQRTYLELEQQQQRLNDTVNFERTLQNELRRSWLELEEKRKRLENTGYQEELFNQSVLRSRQAIQEQTTALGLANQKLAEGKISLQEYADILGQVNERLLSSDQLLKKYTAQSEDEVALTRRKKEALDQLIENYKQAGGVGTESFRKTAEALGINSDQLDLIVAQYGSYADLVQERNEAIKKSIFSASKTFVDEFTQAFIQGKNVLDSFKNFFVNILNNIASELIKQQIAKPIASLLGNFIGGLIPGLADGGIAKSNQAYIIGEEGPELFVPGKTGRVLPNDVLGSTMGAQDGGNGALTVNFTINAVDTQTGVQFLLQNKPVITSMISDAYNRRGRRGPLD